MTLLFSVMSLFLTFLQSCSEESHPHSLFFISGYGNDIGIYPAVVLLPKYSDFEYTCFAEDTVNGGRINFFKGRFNLNFAKYGSWSYFDNVYKSEHYVFWDSTSFDAGYGINHPIDYTASYLQQKEELHLTSDKNNEAYSVHFNTILFTAENDSLLCSKMLHYNLNDDIDSVSKYYFQYKYFVFSDSSQLKLYIASSETRQRYYATYFNSGKAVSFLSPAFNIAEDNSKVAILNRILFSEILHSLRYKGSPLMNPLQEVELLKDYHFYHNWTP